MSAPSKAAIAANAQWLGLEALDLLAREAGERADRARVEHDRAVRDADAQVAPLRDYWEAVGAGDRERDEELERELRDRARAAQEDVVSRPHFGRDGHIVRVEVVHQAAEARLAGATRAAEEAQERVDGYLRAHVRDLGRELTPRTVAARDAFDAAWRQVQEAEREWFTVLQRWARLCPVAYLPLDELPAPPLRGIDRAMDRGAPLPMPASLAAALDEEVR